MVTPKQKPIKPVLPAEQTTSVASSIDFIREKTVLTVNACTDKTYPEVLQSMKEIDGVLFAVADLQKDLGFQRKRLSIQASKLRQLQPVIKPAEGEIRTGANGKSYIFLGSAWGDYLTTPSASGIL